MQGISSIVFVVAACTSARDGWKGDRAGRATVTGHDVTAVVGTPPAAQADDGFRCSWRVGASPSDPVVPRPLATRALASGITARVLRADASGAYWVAPDGNLWALRNGATSRSMLASGTDPAPSDVDSVAMHVSETDVFWSVRPLGSSATLHRTGKDGTRKLDLVIPGSCRLLTADETFVYVVIARPEDGACALVATLPLDNSSTTVTNRLEAPPPAGVGELISDRGTLFWIEAPAYGATVYASGIRTIRRDELRSDRAIGGKPFSDVSTAWHLQPFGERLFVGTIQGIVTVGRPLSNDEERGKLIANLGGPPFSIIPVGTSYVASYECGGRRLVVDVTGTDVFLIADHVQTDVQLASDDIIFVDRDQRLEAISVRDIP
jgi:hypothetical protein